MAKPTPSSLLSEIEREQLALYVAPDSNDTPGWIWPVLGLGTALMLAANDLGSVVVSIVAVVLFAALLGGITATLSERSGVQLRLRTMPPSLRRILLWYWIPAGLLILGGGFLATFVVAHPLKFTIFGIGAGLVAGFGGWLTVRRYEARARSMAREAGLSG